MKSRGYARILDGLDRAGVALTLLAALGAIASATKLSADHPYLLPIVLLAYGVGTILLVLARVGRTGIRLTPWNTTVLTILYILLSFWDLITVLIGLPFIFLTIILGPLMTVVCVLSAYVLGMYFVEEVIGYDIHGHTSLLKSGWHAGVAAAVMVVALLVIGWHYSRKGGGDWLVDAAGEISFGLRRRIQRMIQQIIRKYRRT